MDKKRVIRQILDKLLSSFCRYLTNVGPSLVRNNPASYKSHHLFLSGNFSTSLYFEEISEHEVDTIWSTSYSGSATGFDNVSTSFIQKNYYFTQQSCDSYS